MHDQHRGDAASQADTAACRQIDVARQNEQQHAQRQHAGHRELNQQHAEVARGQKLRGCDGKYRAQQQQHRQQRQHRQ
jgi:hypothetical protein